MIQGRSNLFNYWDQLTPQEQVNLRNQVKEINELTYSKQLDVLKQGAKKLGKITPFRDFINSGSPEMKQIGRKLIQEKKVGCLLVAGGMGSRLNFDKPKGLFPISNIKHKTLFQLFAEKVHACDPTLPVAIMTSPLTHEATEKYFHDNNNFGLKNLIFFTQGTLPFLDEKGKEFLDRKDHVAVGPDGNGSALEFFYSSGIWKQWNLAGVQYVNFIMVDNPLADPFDVELIGVLASKEVDIAAKCILREDPNEKVGTFVKINQTVRVIEYSEFPQEEREAREDDGTLEHCCSNISNYCFRMDFINIAAQKKLPLHSTFKAVNKLDDQGISEKPDQPNAWKFEKFIFDVFEYGHVCAVISPRQECFSPLKTDNDIQKVQQDLQQRDRDTFTAISGLEAPKTPFELSQVFYYPSEQFKDFWVGRPLPENVSYIKAQL